jgi:hypothetical protein
MDAVVLAGYLNRLLAFVTNFGVLIGLILLVYEVRQNSDLMRAQISMERATTSIQILTDIANGGDLIPVDVKLYKETEGFPKTLGWSKTLTAEEKRRYEYWMYMRLTELNNDWFQCTVGLVSRETCRNEVGDNMRRSIHRFYELGISFTRSESGLVSEMQKIARTEGLPEINDNGSWQN